MTTIEATEPGRERATDPRLLVGRRAGRRDSVEAVGLLVGILGILLVVAMTIGAAAPV